MTDFVEPMRKALAEAGYPAPLTASNAQADRVTLYWDAGLDWMAPEWEQPWITVRDNGTVTVDVDHVPDAQFTLGRGQLTPAERLALLYPLIADRITHASGDAKTVPVPASVPRAHMPAFALLVRTRDDVHAHYLDGSRIWVGHSDLAAVADQLRDTNRGDQLGITAQTAVAVTTADGIAVVNPNSATPAGVRHEDGSWAAAITFPEINLTGATVELNPSIRYQSTSDARRAATSEIERSVAQSS